MFTRSTLNFILSYLKMGSKAKEHAQRSPILNYRPLETPDLSKIKSLVQPSEKLDVAVLKNGRYAYSWDQVSEPSGRSKFFKMLFKIMSASPPSKREVDSKICHTIDKELIRSPCNAGDARVTWMGHACFLVQIGNIRILIDPVWSERCSPFRFFGPKRFCPTPCDLDELLPIHILIISHNHYDHMDASTIKRLGKDPIYLVPLGNGKTLRSLKVDPSRIVELDWWEEYPVTPDLRLACLPAKHWSRRGLFDKNKALWSSWALLGNSKKIYFSGDSGYCNTFKSIGAKLGPFDLALIGIGAYEPRWAMRESHLSPGDAVGVHVDIKSKHSIAMHWGTWMLGIEEAFDPPKQLKLELEGRSLHPNSFITILCGETYYIAGDSADQ